MVRTAAASAPEMNTALIPMRNLREPARRRALPMRGDIGNSARRLKTRMGDCFRGEAGTKRKSKLSSAGGASVLGLDRHRSPVVELLDAPDHADAAPEHLLGARVPADVVRLARSPGDQRQPRVAGAEGMRYSCTRRTGDDRALAHGVRLRLGSRWHRRRQLE